MTIYKEIPIKCGDGEAKCQWRLIINALNFILLVIVVAIFWVLKSKLGTHGDTPPSKPQKPAKPPIISARESKEATEAAETSEAKDAAGGKAGTDAKAGKAGGKPPLRVINAREHPRASQGLNEIMASDGAFDIDRFLSGANAAYELILRAFATHDRTALAELVSDDVLAGFEEAMAAREAKGQRLETIIIKCEPPEIYDAELSNQLARITVQIEAELASRLITESAPKAESEGEADSEKEADTKPPAQTMHTIDLWTFERDIKSPSPNWTLIATDSLAA